MFQKDETRQGKWSYQEADVSQELQNAMNFYESQRHSQKVFMVLFSIST
jgi:hypothetical protein